MKNKYILLITSILFFCSGCASRPFFTPVPTPENGQALIYIYRNQTSLYYSIRAMKIQINGQYVTSLRNKSYIWFYVNPGDYIIESICCWDGQVRNSPLKVSVAPYKTYHINFEVGFQTPENGLKPAEWTTHIPGTLGVAAQTASMRNIKYFYSKFLIVEKEEAISSLYECKQVPVEADLENLSK